LPSSTPATPDRRTPGPDAPAAKRSAHPAPQPPPAADVARRRLAAVAGHSGDLATAWRSLGDPDPATRAVALGALRRLDALPAATLVAAMSDPKPVLRRRACEEAAALHRSGGPTSDGPTSDGPTSDGPTSDGPTSDGPTSDGPTSDGPTSDGARRHLASALVGRLADVDGGVAEAACFALGEVLGSDENGTGVAAPSAVAALAETATGHREPLCREAAVAALGAIGDPAALRAILAATTDRPAVRRRAVLALAPFEGPGVDEAVAKARTDRDWQVRQAAEDLSPDR